MTEAFPSDDTPPVIPSERRRSESRNRRRINACISSSLYWACEWAGVEKSTLNTGI